MRIAVLGTGIAGRTLAPALAERGHDVFVGTRDPDATRTREEWSFDLELRSYETVADGADLVVNATNGQASLDVLAAVGADRLAGDDADARASVVGLLAELGWRDVVEFDELSAARGMEMWLPLWLRLLGRLGTADFNIAVVR